MKTKTPKTRAYTQTEEGTLIHKNTHKHTDVNIHRYIHTLISHKTQTLMLIQTEKDLHKHTKIQTHTHPQRPTHTQTHTHA